MAPIIWSAVAENTTQTIVEWMERLLAFSGGVFGDPTSGEHLTAAGVRQGYDGLYEALQELGVRGPADILPWLSDEGFNVAEVEIGGHITRDMQKHIFKKCSLIRPVVARLETACVAAVLVLFRVPRLRTYISHSAAEDEWL